MPIADTADGFSDELRRVADASRFASAIRACLLTTRDRDHALNMLEQVVVRTDRTLYHFTVAGRRRYVTAQGRWEVVGADAASALALLRHAQEIRGGAIVVVEDVVGFLRDEGGDPQVRMTVADLLSSTAPDGLVLVFLEPPEAGGRLPSMLADQFVRLEVPYPRAHELAAIAREELAVAAHRARVGMGVERIRAEADRLASGLVGLTRSAARDVLRDALAPDPSELDTAFGRLQQRKTQTLRRELAMNVLDSSDVEEPVGLDYLLEYLDVIRDSVRVSGPGRARGVLLIGPPGTGKTMLARSIGRTLGLPVVEFRISSLMSSLLGETERRFSQAFATLEAMSPNVVFIDEIEKAFGDSSERDGGTMMRCTGALLSWLSDNRAPNFIVATSNNLRRMGEIGQTMTRAERFDRCFFVDVPSRASRELMLARWLRGAMAGSDQAAATLAAATERFSGADLRSLVKEAIGHAAYRGTSLTIEALGAQAERKRMRALALHDEFQELRRWGSRHCDPAAPADA